MMPQLPPLNPANRRAIEAVLMRRPDLIRALTEHSRTHDTAVKFGILAEANAVWDSVVACAAAAAPVLRDLYIAVRKFVGDAEHNELSFEAGETLVQSLCIGRGWCLGRSLLRADVGWFPLSHVLHVTELEHPARPAALAPASNNALPTEVVSEVAAAAAARPAAAGATAVAAFAGVEGARELSFAPGDRVLVVRQSEDGWWFGEARGRLGRFPAACVVLDSARGEAASAAAVAPVVGRRGRGAFADWYEIRDPVSGCVYYTNVSTNEAVWALPGFEVEAPMDVAADVIQLDFASGAGGGGGGSGDGGGGGAAGGTGRGDDGAGGGSGSDMNTGGGGGGGVGGGGGSGSGGRGSGAPAAAFYIPVVPAVAAPTGRRTKVRRWWRAWF